MSYRVLPCSVTDAKAKEMGMVAGGLGLLGLAVVASDKGGQGGDRRPDIKSATPSFFLLPESLKFT